MAYSTTAYSVNSAFIGNVTIAGDNAADALVIVSAPVDGVGQVMVHQGDGNTTPGTAGAFNSAVDWDSNTAGDQILVADPATNLRVNVGGGAGVAHSVSIATPSNMLGTTFILNNTSNNSVSTVNLVDNTSAAASTYNIDVASVTGPGFTISEPGSPFTGGVNLLGSTGGDTFNVNGTFGNEPHALVGSPTGDTFNVHNVAATAGPAPALAISGNGGADTVLLTNAGSVQGIAGTVVMVNTGGSMALTVDDSADATARTATISEAAITGLAPGALVYVQSDLSSLTIKGGTGNNTFTVANTPSNATAAVPTLLQTGTGADTVAVLATSTGTPGAPLTIDAQGSPTPATVPDVVVIGAGGTAQNILGPINVVNTGGLTNLLINDAANTNATNVAISESAVNGLAPAAIAFNQAQLFALTVAGGTGNNNFTVANTPSNATVTVPTTIATGTGVDTVVVLATSTGTPGSPLTIDNQGNPTPTTTPDVVVIGGVGGTGTVQNIQGPVVVANTGGFTNLLINDAADAAARTVTMTEAAVAGLAPSLIAFNQAQLFALTVTGGSGGNTFTVANTPSNGALTVPTALNTGSGLDTVAVLATSTGTPGAPLAIDNQGGPTPATTPDVVVIGAGGTAQNILGPINVVNTGGLTNLLINDAANTNATNVVLNEAAIVGLSPAAITYDQTAIANLLIQGGSGGNTFVVLNTPASVGVVPTPTTLQTGAGANSVLIAATAANTLLTVDDQGSVSTNTIGAAGSVANILGQINFLNSQNSTLAIDASADAVAHTMTLQVTGTNAVLTGLTAQPIQYPIAGGAAALRALAISTGSLSDSLTVDFTNGNPIPQTAPANPLTPGLAFNAGGGADAMVLQGGTFVNETYQATGPGTGTINLDGTSTIAFANLQPVTDVVTVTNYTFIPPPGASFINVGTGPVYLGFQTATISDNSGTTPPAFEQASIANKTNVIVEGSTVEDTVRVNLPIQPTGLAALIIPTFGDTDQVILTATPPNVVTLVNGGPGADVVSVAAAGLGSGSTTNLDGGPGLNTLNVDAAGLTFPVIVTANSITQGPGNTVVLTFSNFSTINITNAPSTPALVVLPPVPINAVQGTALVDAVVARFTDATPGAKASQFQATINWGDGMSTAGIVTADASNPILFYVTGSHVYTTFGAMTVTTSIVDSGGTTTTNVGGVTITIMFAPQPAVTATSPATVADLSFTAQGASPSFVEGISSTVLAGTFSYPDATAVPGDFTVTINWGDGSAPTPGIVTLTGTLPNGRTFSVSGTHTYQKEGHYPITIDVLHGVGSEALGTGAATVADGPITVTAISPVIPFPAGTLVKNAAIATFTDSGAADPASTYQVTVDWGDGTSGPGVIIGSTVIGGIQQFTVGGTHTYATPGSYTGSVLVENSVGTKGSAPFTVQVVAPTLTGIPVTGTEDQPLVNVPVATLSVVGMTLTPGNYQATINWGDNTTPTDATIVAGANGSLTVLGSHTYIESGSFTATVSFRTPGNSSLITTTSPVTINDVPIVLTLSLNPSTDSGVSHTDFLTNVTQPGFFGSSEPQSVISLFAQNSNGTGPRIALGTTTADSGGAWSLTSTAMLADGSYTITAAAVDRNGVTKVEKTLARPLVIDTVGPTVTGLTFDRLTGKYIVTLRDDRGGLDQATLGNGNNFVFSVTAQVHGRIRSRQPLSTSVLVSPAAGPTDPQAVTIILNRGRPLIGGRFQIEVLSGGVRDAAGNALDGEFFGTFPSGNGIPGGNFVANVTAFHRTTFAPLPQTSFVSNGTTIIQGPLSLFKREKAAVTVHHAAAKHAAKSYQGPLSLFKREKAAVTVHHAAAKHAAKSYH